MNTAAQAQGECLKPTLERKHAQAAARRLRERDKHVQAYRCVECGGWHVGTSSGLKRPKKTLRTNHQIHYKEPRMAESHNARDVYARHTSKDGESYVATHRVWNSERFFAARAAEAEKVGGKARCEQITKEQFDKEHA